MAVLEAKSTMIIGGSIYIFFSASFLFPSTWLLYTMSAIAGFGSALLWTAQGNYLTLCSTSETIGRNSGVFWCILQFRLTEILQKFKLLIIIRDARFRTNMQDLIVFQFQHVFRELFSFLGIPWK